jgi:hypothetical protein
MPLIVKHRIPTCLKRNTEIEEMQAKLREEIFVIKYERESQEIF